MVENTKTKFVVLAVLDGWGLAAPGAGNAVEQANTINMDRFMASYPHTTLAASGESVGLPRNEPGNTETGHLNLGAGRIVYQDLARINKSIAEGTFFNNLELNNAIDHAIKNNSNLHLMGLVGAGGVHSNAEHLYAITQLCARKKFDRVFIHIFTDGRDSPPTAALSYVNQLRDVLKKEGVGIIASIMGRYWAMDRDLRWERTAKAYKALTKGEGHLVKTPGEAIELNYLQGKTDEFIEPSIISDSKGIPLAKVKENDSIIFFNFRIDRPRQLTSAFVSKNFKASAGKWDFDPYAVKYEKKHEVVKKTSSPASVFERGEAINNLYFVMMTEYGKRLVEEGAKAAFPPEMVEVPLGRIISDANLRQLRVSESEKERFVTFYFNGQRETVFPGEERLIVNSPKVPTYDSKPEMSAVEMTDKLLETLRKDNQYSFILINYANADMVGHTGSIGPTVKACEVVDEQIGKLANFVLAFEGTLLITADHGNAEDMINPHSGQIDTEHSKNSVPLVVVSKNFLGKSVSLTSGILADVAPTILGLLNLKIPEAMNGRDLLKSLNL